MSIWVDPNLLSLVGLGLAADPDVPDGRHLRWFFGRYVGFPRSGFRLSRHKSLVDAAWDAPNPDPLIHAQPTSQADVGLGLTRRFPSGLTISKAGGFTYQSVASGSPSLLRLDAQAVTLDFGPSGPGPTFPPGPGLSNPAAFVRLTIQRRKTTGFVSATAYYDAHPELRYQDSGLVGPPFVGWFPPVLAGSVLESAAGWRIRSSAERLLPKEALADRDRVSAEAGSPKPLDPNPWITQTILLHGSFIEKVVITGSDAVLSKVQWVTVREYAAASQWEVVDTFFLPLTNEPAIYPPWSPLSGETIAFNRLTLAPPNRNLPWDDEAQAVETNLKKRYLGETFVAMDDAMRLFLKGELDQSIPQAEVEVVQELAEDPPGEEPETVKTALRPLDHLYAAAADPQVARILGLMTTDAANPGSIFDYLVQCNVPQKWVQWSLSPSEAKRQASLSPRAAAAASRDDILIAMATGLVMKPAPAPEAPAGLVPRVDPDLNAKPMPAQVELSWLADLRGVFENGAATRVFYELRRLRKEVPELLHHKEEGSGLLMPYLPTQRLPRDGRLRLVDRSIPDWDDYTWSLRGMDLWGRFSKEAVASANVRDTLPPPAPTSLDATMSASAPLSVTVAFDWTGQQELLAPDLERFEIHLVQHTVDRAVEASPATWGRFEHVPGATSPPVVVRWPGLGVEGLPSGITGAVAASPIVAEEGGGQRIAVTLKPLSVPFGASHVALVSATVRAIDVFANQGPFAAHVEARRFDVTPPVVPVMPGDVRLASRPDTLGRAALKIEWPDLTAGQAAGQVRVLRAGGSALLAAAGFDMAVWETMDRTQRAQTLRSAALDHREVFVADHEVPYGGGAGSHVAYLNAGETGLTVFTVQAVSPAGVKAGWPSSGAAFVVAAVPVTRPPEPPLVTEARSGDRQVMIRIAPDLSGEASAVRLYRSRDAAQAADVRSMRLLREAATPSTAQLLQIDDHEVFPDVDYWYRAVAVGANGTSTPSAAVLARPFTTLPPEAPTIVEARRLSPAGAVAVRARIARRDLPLFLLRRATGAVGLKPASGPGIGPDGRLDLTVLTAQPNADGYEITVQDQAPAGTVFRYLLRVRDAQGRQSESDPVEETP